MNDAVGLPPIPGRKSAGSGSRRSSPFLGAFFGFAVFAVCQNGRPWLAGRPTSFDASRLKFLRRLDFGAQHWADLAIDARLAFLIVLTVKLLDVAACDWHLPASVAFLGRPRVRWTVGIARSELPGS